MLGLKGNEVTIVNRYDHLTLDHLTCKVYPVADRSRIAPETTIKLPLGIKPHTKATFHVPYLPRDPPTETYLHVQFTLTEPTSWADTDNVLAWDQVLVHKPRAKTCAQLQAQDAPRSIPGSLVSAGPRINRVSESLLTVTSDAGTQWAFDLAAGLLVGWRRPRRPDLNIITEPITLDFYRALTDNDRGGRFGREWLDRRLHQTKQLAESVHWEQDPEGITITVRGKVAPPVLAWKVDLTTSYRIMHDSLLITVKGRPYGLRLPGTFARIGLTMGILDASRARWWGRGPGESYRDKKQSQAFGNWEQSIKDLFVDYEFPQDGGNRTDVRWVEIMRDKPQDEDKGEDGVDASRLIRARFGDLDGASFSAMHYTTKDLDKAQHPYELRAHKREDDAIVRFDWAHHGLGTGSCGPATLPQYELKSENFSFDLLLD